MDSYSYALLDVDLALKAIIDDDDSRRIYRIFGDYEEVGFPFTVACELEILIQAAGVEARSLLEVGRDNLREITKPLYATKAVSAAYEEEFLRIVRDGQFPLDPDERTILQHVLWFRAFLKAIRAAPDVTDAAVLTTNRRLAERLGADDARLVALESLQTK